MTIVGLHDFVKVSISASLKSFLLVMCIDAPESTTNSRSSGLRFDGAGRHQFSEGDKNAALFFSFNFRLLVASLEDASRAHRSCHSVSSWDRSSNFGALGLRWWGSIQNRSRRSVVWLMLLQHSYCTFVIILFGPFARLFFNPAMRIRALFTKSATTLGLVEQAYWRMPFFTEWVSASSFQVILAGQSKHFSTRAFASRTSGSRFISLILPRRKARGKIRLCHFCTQIDIVTETASVSFHTLPVSFPLPTIS